MSNETLAVDAQKRLDQANEMYRAGKEKGTQMSLLLLALTVKDLFPTCKTVRLERSDQGDFMSIEGADLLDEDGREVNGEDDYSRINLFEEAEVAFAWNLEPSDKTWTQYTTNGKETFDVDSVIARLRGRV